MWCSMGAWSVHHFTFSFCIFAYFSVRPHSKKNEKKNPLQAEFFCGCCFSSGGLYSCVSSYFTSKHLRIGAVYNLVDLKQTSKVKKTHLWHLTGVKKCPPPLLYTCKPTPVVARRTWLHHQCHCPISSTAGRCWQWRFFFWTQQVCISGGIC